MTRIVGGSSDDLINASLLGLLTKRRPGRGSTSRVPDCLFAFTYRDREARIRNVVQMAATILSASRVTFLSLVLKLIRYADPGKMEICYMGEPEGSLLFSPRSSFISIPQTPTPR